MQCCGTCFGDNFLRVQIESMSETKGSCPYCNAQHVDLIDPVELRDYFEFLIGIYSRDDNGEKLINLLHADWALFPDIDDIQSTELLATILDDRQIIGQRFCPSMPDDGSDLERWQLFRDELKHQNRFFPKLVPDLDRLKELLDSYLCADPSCLPGILYRARINNSETPYLQCDMGRPPKVITMHGRANPAGIPYLYLASDQNTAISEIRPHTSETISVASFQLNTELTIIDLRNPRKTISPFSLSDEHDVSLLRRDINFLCQLGQELSRPVLPKSAHLEYLPSQYLCEFIKDCGFDGVMYRSSVGAGTNFALFAKDLEQADDVKQYIITRVSVEIEEFQVISIPSSVDIIGERDLNSL